METDRHLDGATDLRDGARGARVVADVAHDLRQPLQSARVFLHLLAGSLSEDRQRGLAARVDEALEQADALATALFEAADLASGVRRPEIRPTDLGALTALVASEFAERAEARGADLRLGPGSVGGLTDPAVLGRLLRAVLCDATAGDGPVRALVGARRRGGRASVQLVHAPARAEEGPALRLLRAGAGALGHEVLVRRTPSGGRSVEILMALAEAPTPPAARLSEAAVGEAPAGSRLVAVAEDDALQLMALLDMLEGWGHRAVGAPDARTLLRRLDAGGAVPDLVLADAGLAGGTSGLDAIRAVRDRAGSPLPALLVTGSPEDFQEAALADDGVFVVPKPVRPAALRRALERALAGLQPAEPA
jgi:CheY-like chemotaxis protein